MEKNNTHLAGEYFVAAELYRRGYSVGMTIGNAKAIDMFVTKDGKPISIQVKAIRNKKSVSWPIKKSEIEDNIIYIFVNLNDKEQPDYYIAKGKDIKDLVDEYKTNVLNLNKLNREKNGFYKNNWAEIDI